ncbi:hypothetical protein AOQ84DRAFT_164804 [Glonium stellatum]|uniref:Uncharacterized protein n=1 Tax=Glonium stellatum TaxID=574774 RepID=A0A8E2JMK4_9PEZI|nr:hypothetical protein AOQ84DRAFT_164804 [Glonium stellatum]
MFFSSIKPPHADNSQTCYFTITPPTYYYSHFSTETPSHSSSSNRFSAETRSDPSNPLLALRPLPPPTTPPASMDASRLLQLQTAAAYPRPSAQPVQNNMSANSSSSSTSSSSSRASSIGAPTPPPEPLVRCSRCHRSSSMISSSSSTNGMVSFGTNLYYCNRCASLVGYDLR